MLGGKPGTLQAANIQHKTGAAIMQQCRVRLMLRSAWVAAEKVVKGDVSRCSLLTETVLQSRGKEAIEIPLSFFFSILESNLP